MPDKQQSIYVRTHSGDRAKPIHLTARVFAALSPPPPPPLRTPTVVQKNAMRRAVPVSLVFGRRNCVYVRNMRNALACAPVTDGNCTGASVAWPPYHTRCDASDKFRLRVFQFNLSELFVSRHCRTAASRSLNGFVLFDIELLQKSSMSSDVVSIVFVCACVCLYCCYVACMYR